MSKVYRVAAMLHGHTRIEFEDGSSIVLPRGSTNRLPVVGEEFPPKKMELRDAVDTKASQETLVERESADSSAADEDESGAAREPEARPRSKRK